MEDRYINLKELLPLYLQEYSELAEIMDTETPEFRLLESRHNRMIDNRYIISCDEEGIARFEKILGMTPKSDDTLEDRICKIEGVTAELLWHIESFSRTHITNQLSQSVLVEVNDNDTFWFKAQHRLYEAGTD